MIKITKQQVSDQIAEFFLVSIQFELKLIKLPLEPPAFLSKMRKEAVVRLDRDDFTIRLGQKLTIPVIGITTIEMVGLLMKSRPQRRRYTQSAAWFRYPC